MSENMPGETSGETKPTDEAANAEGSTGDQVMDAKTEQVPGSEGDAVTENPQETTETDAETKSEDPPSSSAEPEKADSMETDTQGACSEMPKETVTFKIVFNKQKHDVTFPLDDKVQDLKPEIEKITGVPVTMQKVMYKGLMQDGLTLRESKVTKGCKIMLVGSTVNDILSITAPDPVKLKEEIKLAAAASKEPLSTIKPHKTVLDKHGKPDDAIPGVKNRKDPLPHVPVAGMYNKSGGKVRLTFKMEQDQLWIGTKERTDKIPMGSIKAVVSEPLDGHEEYHMMGIQLGPTEASRYWIYWVPAQYVEAIKDAVLGKFQFF